MKKCVILDTDIGGDFDDTWALAMLCRMPELPLKLVLSSSSATEYRAAVAAKFLENTGYEKIPVGCGIALDNPECLVTFRHWLGDYDITRYRGTYYPDGLNEAIRLIEDHDETTIIAIGPFTNIAYLCRTRPDLVPKCRLAAMGGSFRKNFRDAEGMVREYNIVSDLEASRIAFAAPWKEFILTPLDHCGNLVLRGTLYRRLLASDDILIKEVLEQYRSRSEREPELPRWDQESTILYDTAAVYLATTLHNVVFEEKRIAVHNDGFVREDPEGRSVKVAFEWQDKEGYLRELVSLLLNENANQVNMLE